MVVFLRLKNNSKNRFNQSYISKKQSQFYLIQIKNQPTKINSEVWDMVTESPILQINYF